MLHKPINPEPYNTYISKDESEIIGCDIPSNQKIIGDYTRVVDIETSETVFEAYSQYEENPKSRIEYNNVLVNAESGKEYSWNTFYWEQPDKVGDAYGISISAKANTSEILLSVKYNNENKVTSSISTGSTGEVAIYEESANAYQANYKEEYIGKPAIHWDTDSVFFYDAKKKALSITEITEKYGLENIVITAEIDGKVVNSSGIIGVIEDNHFHYLWIFLENTSFVAGHYSNSELQIYLKSSNGGSLCENSLCKINSNYYLIKSAVYTDTNIRCEIYPTLRETVSPTDVSFYAYESYEYQNISPDYYFRCKTSPTITINSTLSTIDYDDMLHDIQSNFSVKFEPGDNCADLNYYQLYLYALSSNGKYVLVEKSNKLFSTNDFHLFKGFIHGSTYKVVAICVDNDGDEWTEEIVFNVLYDIKLGETINAHAKFQNENYAVKINIGNLSDDSTYKIFKHRHGYLCADIVGDFDNMGTALIDYNIQNDMDYTYYIRKDDGTSIVIYKLADITSIFDGSCIMGLEKVSEDVYQIGKTFYLNYHIGDYLHESAQELSRDYIGTFGKYQQELRGSANYITGTAEGLLGYEADGGYAEANHMKHEWLDFINDDSIKLYKGFDGNTMLISITASKVKPRYYPEYGLVNEVNISFKQIGDMENSTIYETEV